MPMSNYDLWLGNYHRHPMTVYCPTKDCPNEDGIEVLYENEYGQGWITPEECPLCGAELLDDKPEAQDDTD